MFAAKTVNFELFFDIPFFRIGVDFASWTESSGIEISNGAIFYMDPSGGPEGTVVLAQITTPIGASSQMSIAAQGRSTSGADWSEYGLTWHF